MHFFASDSLLVWLHFVWLSGFLSAEKHILSSESVWTMLCGSTTTWLRSYRMAILGLANFSRIQQQLGVVGRVYTENGPTASLVQEGLVYLPDKCWRGQRSKRRQRGQWRLQVVSMQLRYELIDTKQKPLSSCNFMNLHIFICIHTQDTCHCGVHLQLPTLFPHDTRCRIRSRGSKRSETTSG